MPLITSTSTNALAAKLVLIPKDDIQNITIYYGNYYGTMWERFPVLLAGCREQKVHESPEALAARVPSGSSPHVRLKPTPPTFASTTRTTWVTY